jgi:uncharacterized membrane protein
VKISDKGAIPEETFTFTMVPATTDSITKDKTDYNINDKSGNVSVEPGVALGTGKDTLTYKYESTDASKAVNNKVTKDDQSFDLTGVTFDHAGVYRYYITETPPEKVEPYITYDSTKYVVDLYVYAESDGTYAPRDMVVTQIKTEGTKTTVSEKPQEICFENSINTKTVSITKEVVGEEYSSDELFDFYIMIPLGGTTIYLSKDSTIQAQIYDKDGALVNDKRSDDDGYVTLAVNGEIANATFDEIQTLGTHFQLKNGETLKVYAPVTMIYYVEEKDYTSEGYTQTYKYDEEGTKDSTTKTKDGEADTEHDALKTVVYGTTNTATNQVTFINTRELSTPNTGISVDLIPYVLVAVIAVCGAMLLISEKKRRTNR